MIVSSVEQLAVERFTLGVAKVLASEWARLQTTHTAVTAPQRIRSVYTVRLRLLYDLKNSFHLLLKE